MSKANLPVQVTSDDDPTMPSSPSSANSTNQTPITAAPPAQTPVPTISPPAPTPPPSAPISSPAPSTEPQPPQPDEAGPSRWRQHLKVRGTPHKRAARLRVRPPTPEVEAFSWVPNAIAKWQAEAGLKEILARCSAFQNSPNIPITREPIERTIPTLVVRTDRQDFYIGELQNRLRQLEGYLQAMIEPRVTRAENRSDQNAHSLAVMRTRLEVVELENANLREDVDEQNDTISDMEEYIDLLEQRLEVVEEDYAHIKALAATFTDVINAFRQIPPPPPPPQA